MGRYLLGFDVGSSSIKASLLDAASGQLLASATSPDRELEIHAPKPGWAEQHPEVWWEHVCQAAGRIARAGFDIKEVEAVGLSYQMHGLVCLDQAGRVLRPAIIWCDSRAVETGEKAFVALGKERCLSALLNSPGNFTASKLRWVKENEAEIFARIRTILWPGDYVAYRMTGQLATTTSALSEGILWDFRKDAPAAFLLDHFGIPEAFLPPLIPTFGTASRIGPAGAEALGLRVGIPVSYRAGDQPNNALSLNVLEPGEVAATAGTSGVVCGISDQATFDPPSRVNTFVHVNHAPGRPRYATLLCVNGTGIFYSWLKRQLMEKGATYEAMNALAASAPAGAEGLRVLPFGNGAERTLGNRDLGAALVGLNFNRHSRAHVLRAAQEGIVFALAYGLKIMAGVGVSAGKVRAGEANMFLSPLFAQTFATVTGATVELFNTDGAQGAARGAGIGAGLYSLASAFESLKAVRTIEPEAKLQETYAQAFAAWLETLRERLGHEL